MLKALGPRLVRACTQNLDGLERRAGLDAALVRELHGCLPDAAQATLPDVALAAAVARRVCFFDDPVVGVGEALEDIAGATVVVVLGSSLRVAPARDMVADAPAHRILVTLDPAAALPPRRAVTRSTAMLPPTDVVLHMDVHDFARAVLARLGVQ